MGSFILSRMRRESAEGGKTGCNAVEKKQKNVRKKQHSSVFQNRPHWAAKPSVRTVSETRIRATACLIAVTAVPAKKFRAIQSLK
jgi:hypothetical protein